MTLEQFRKSKNLSHKNRLVGHLTNSFEIEDKDDWFMVNVSYQNIKRSDPRLDTIQLNALKY